MAEHSEADWDAFLSAATALGFQKLWNTTVDEQDLVILAHTDGIIMAVESTTDWRQTKVVNDSHISCHCRITKGKKAHVSFGSWHHQNRYCAVYSMHARNAQELTDCITTLRKVGTFITPWPRDEFIWLICHNDCKNDRGGDYSDKYDRLNAERLAHLPQWVRDMVDGQHAPVRKPTRERSARTHIGVKKFNFKGKLTEQGR